MQQYDIFGMSCAACSARVEKAVTAVDGVTSCSVNLLTNSMQVEGTATDAQIVAAVTQAGYGAEKKENKEIRPKKKNKDNETQNLRQRLYASLLFLAALMYVSMGHTMWGFPLPAFFYENYVAIGLVQLLLSGAIMIINQKFFINGFRGLKNGAANMDTLVALGSGASFVYSTCMLFLMTAAIKNGDISRAKLYAHDLYFESAAMILTLITVGKMLETRAKGKTTDALKKLVALAPKTAVVIKDGKETEIPAEQVKVGDVFVVRPGAAIPVDGIVLSGHSAINEAALTGESIPVDKTEGDNVSAATVNTAGFLECRATGVGKDTMLSKIIQMVSDAAATKAPIAKIANKVSAIFVPVVMGIAAVTLLVWLLSGASFGFSLSRAISVLVISCPCALGLATPVAIMVGNGIGAKYGILFKTAASLEETGRAHTVVLDKTGTVTLGEPVVTDLVPFEMSETELLKIACTLEQKSEHPLAKAILKKAEEEKILPEETTAFCALPGNGLHADWNGTKIYGGKLAFIKEYTTIPARISEQAEVLANQGKTPLFFAKETHLCGIIAVSDVLKKDSAQAIEELKNMGIRTVMLTGDNERTAKAIGGLAGVDEVIAEVLPHEKERVIRTLKQHGKVIMVGDGINDAPALTSADIGIAIGAGTDIAIDAADVVLLKSSMTDVPAAIQLSRATKRTIYQNLFWAFLYNIIGIPLAAGVWIPLFGLSLNPMFGAAAMSLSSFCVVANALRLNFVNIKSPKKDKVRKQKKEKKEMETILKIEGMMCMHCSGRVKTALEALDGVSEAVVSHETGTAEVKMTKEIPYDLLKATVEAQGYTITE